MGEAKAKEKQCVFGVSYEGQAGDPDRTPVVIVGVPQAAWAHMSDGSTHTFDLTHVGVPVKLILFGGPSRAAVMALLSAAQQSGGAVDMTDHDFSMKPIEPKEGDKP